jgi:tetratricopeptide (TPR) repeat protein
MVHCGPVTRIRLPSVFALSFVLALGACKQEETLTPEQIAAKVKEATEHGDAEFAAQKEDLAEKSYQAALELDANYGPAHVGLAKVELERKAYDAAAKQAEKAISLTADDPKAHLVLGDVKMAQEDFAAAVTAYGKASELAPADTRYGLKHGQALNAAKNFAEAEGVLRKVGEEDEQIQFVWSDLGDALMGQDKYDEALRIYMKAQFTYESDRRAFAGAGTAYEKKGEITKAVDQWSRYIQRDCCSTWSTEVAKPKLEELRAKEQAALEAASEDDAAAEGEAPAE